MKNLWSWFNGKKTFIGLALYFVLGGLLQVGFIDQVQFDQFKLYAEVVIGAGIGHKLIKLTKSS